MKKDIYTNFWISIIFLICFSNITPVVGQNLLIQVQRCVECDTNVGDQNANTNYTYDPLA